MHNDAIARLSSVEIDLNYLAPIKCYDSRHGGRARLAPDSAFVDPTTPDDAPPRESIELRTLVFHHAGSGPAARRAAAAGIEHRVEQSLMGKPGQAEIIRRVGNIAPAA